MRNDSSRYRRGKRAEPLFRSCSCIVPHHIDGSAARIPPSATKQLPVE